MSVVPEFIRQWYQKPGFVQYVKHAYWIGGYDIIPNAGLDIDDLGLDWVRTFNLRNRQSGLEFRVIHPEDMHVIVGPYPSEETVIEMYGPPVRYEFEYFTPAQCRRYG